MTSATPDPSGTDHAHTGARRAANGLSVVLTQLMQLRATLEQRAERRRHTMDLPSHRTPEALTREQGVVVRDAKLLPVESALPQHVSGTLDAAAHDSPGPAGTSAGTDDPVVTERAPWPGKPPAHDGRAQFGPDGQHDLPEHAQEVDAAAVGVALGAAAVAYADAGAAQRDIDAIGAATDGHDGSLADNDVAVRAARADAASLVAGVRSGRVSPRRAAPTARVVGRTVTGQQGQVQHEGRDLIEQRRRDLAVRMAAAEDPAQRLQQGGTP